MVGGRHICLFASHFLRRGVLFALDQSLNTKIDFRWYKKGTNNKWTYDMMDHLMVGLETINALAFWTYVIGLDAYELHPWDEEVFNNFINVCQGFTLYLC